ncbi:MAG: cell division protein FtsZ [Candidatus Marsarchaeota archaeon]|jgi:cell division protein FtsZ|nr:cell division protein FtsZ [Candidatus Marsarchaeota archaeon]
MNFFDSEIKDRTNDNINEEYFQTKIAVVGCGGGGSNSILRIARMGIRGATLIAVNTDAKHLKMMDQSIKRILIGGVLTNGMGAGGFPDIGEKAAVYSKQTIEDSLRDYNMVFVTAGMGGGTGTGAAPIVADIAKSRGAIVIGIVTFPFALERVRLEVARKGIEELRKHVDTLIIIDNQRLFSLYPNLAIDQAFKIADEVTAKAVRGITEAINTPSLINVDFADIKSIMNGGGLAFISIGEGSGPNKVEEAVRDTFKNKLLDVDYSGANSVLIHITGGNDLTLGDANEIGKKLTELTVPDANVIWGARVEPTYNSKVSVIAIFTGIKSANILGGTNENNSKKQGLGLEEI